MTRTRAGRARIMLKNDDKDGDGKVSWEEFSGDKGKGWGTTNTSTTSRGRAPLTPRKIPVVVEDKKPSKKTQADTKTSKKTTAKTRVDTKTNKKTKGNTKASDKDGTIITEKDGTIIREKTLEDGTAVRKTSKGKRPVGATTIQSEL